MDNLIRLIDEEHAVENKKLEAEMAAMVVKYDNQLADQERDVKRLERDKKILQAVVDETQAELRELKAMLNGTLAAMRRRHDEGGVSGL